MTGTFYAWHFVQMPIEFIPFHSQPEHFKKLRSSMAFEDWHWVVPDGAAKASIQKLKWEMHRTTLEHCVSSHGTYWLEQVLKSHARIEIISPALLTVLIRRWSRKRSLSWLQSPQSLRKVAKFLELFSPIFATQNTASFEQWLGTQPESIQNWGLWYAAAKDLWNDLESKGWFPNTLAESLMLLEPDAPIENKKPVVFDLGFSLDLSAVALIQNLAKHTEVQVFVPESLISDGFSLWKTAYERLGYKFETTKPEAVSHQFLRFASTAAAIKQTTGQVRAWLEKGIHPERILICGNLEESEKVILNEHLKFEGIPSSAHLDKNVSKPLEMAWLLNQLNILNRHGKSADLEWSLYATAEGHALSVSAFLNKWRNVYDPDSMATGLQNSRGVNVRMPSGEIPAEEWLDVVYQLIGTKQKKLLVQMLQAAALKIPESLELEFEEWSEVFSGEALQLRSFEEPGADTFSWSEWNAILFHEFDRCIVPDCSSRELKADVEQLISAKEAVQIERDLGIGLKMLDPDRYRAGMQWLIGHHLNEPAQFYFAGANIDGQLQEPDPLWLKNWMETRTENSPEVHLPMKTRWDSLAMSNPSVIQNFLKIDPAGFENILTGLKADAGQYVPLNFSRKYKKTWSLSAGQIEKGLNCPFVFLAGKGFRLPDNRDLDLDIGAITRGRWQHLVLQQIKTAGRLDLNDLELDRLLEDLRPKVSEEIYDEFMWPSLKRKTIWMVKRFLTAELEHQKQFPDSHFSLAEAEWRADWSREHFEFVPEGQGDVTFSGRIDRVDSGPDGQKLVYDYKNSHGEYRNHGSWIEKNELQLALYSYVIEKGFLKNVPAADVEGAFYYFLKDMKRDKGMVLESSVLATVNNYNKISKEEKTETYQALKLKIGKFVDQVERGFFAAQPRDEKKCPQCRWKNVCRAPHLN